MRVEGVPGHPLIFMAFHNLIHGTLNSTLNIWYLIPTFERLIFNIQYLQTNAPLCEEGTPCSPHSKTKTQQKINTPATIALVKWHVTVAENRSEPAEEIFNEYFKVLHKVAIGGLWPEWVVPRGSTSLPGPEATLDDVVRGSRDHETHGLWCPIHTRCFFDASSFLHLDSKTSNKAQRVILVEDGTRHTVQWRRNRKSRSPWLKIIQKVRTILTIDLQMAPRKKVEAERCASPCLQY